MKKTRKLIPALAMLLLSAVLMSTASFAWFSMNTTVAVEGMTVQAEVKQTFLLISKDSDEPADIQAAGTTKVTATNGTDISVYPAMVTPGSTTDELLTFQYYKGKDYNNGSADGAAVNVGKSDQYVLKHTYYITVAKNAPAASNIVVTGVTISGTNAPAGVAIATAYAVDNYTANSTAESRIILSGDMTITDSTVLTVHVYVYINGEDSSVTTANAANLGTATVNVTFGVKGANESGT